MKSISILLKSSALFSLISLCCAASCNKSAGTRETPPTDTTVVTPPVANGPAVALWLTKGDKSVLFQKQTSTLNFGDVAGSASTITVDTTQTFQTIDGFGYTLTGGSAQHLMGMSAAARAALLQELFGTDGNNIGISYLRVSIGASDLDAVPFSYNDLPAGETDLELKKFDLGPDKQALIPVLKEILAINPGIKILGSPWSPPVWMKDNGDTRGGSLKPEYHDVYARYLIKYIQAMKREGITIEAITIQNEPLHPGNNPSLKMEAPQQAAFIKGSLGPQFRAAGITTKIILYDHNLDHPEYPITVLNDADAKQYIDGSAFHHYAGTIEAMSQVHNAHPDKALYFTEHWIGAPGDFPNDLKWHVKNLIIGAPRNWSRTVLEWNLSSNPALQPHTDRGGCDRCLGAITIDGSNVTRNPAYYIIAHASKFVRPGSVRIGSNVFSTLPNVAFKTPDGNKVLIVLNDGTAAQTFHVQFGGKKIAATLDAGAVGTYVW
jgi:glucosylceramidase